MSDLVEHILSENYLSANEIFKDHMNNITEKKLLETKKQIQAEAVGGLTAKEIADRRERGYVRASEVLRDPRDVKLVLNKNVKKTKKQVYKKKNIDEDFKKDLSTAAAKGLNRTLGRVGIGIGKAVKTAINAKRAAEVGSRLAQHGVRSLKKSAKDTALKAVSDPLAAAGQAASAVGKGVGTAAKGVASTAKSAYKNTRTSGTKTNTALRYIAGALSSVEEETKSKKKSTSNKLRIIKDKYKTKATNVAIEE